jgi:protein gp37
MQHFCARLRYNDFGLSLQEPGSRKGILVMPHMDNIWVGVSVEDQETADERLPILAETPAAVRIVSYEPAIGGVDFSKWLLKADGSTPDFDWLIAGGETGAHARTPCPSWFWHARDQAKAAGIPFFFKQWGDWGNGVMPPKDYQKDHLNRFTKQRPVKTTLHGEVMQRMGKRAAGRALDGVIHNAFPRRPA